MRCDGWGHGEEVIRPWFHIPLGIRPRHAPDASAVPAVLFLAASLRCCVGPSLACAGAWTYYGRTVDVYYRYRQGGFLVVFLAACQMQDACIHIHDPHTPTPRRSVLLPAPDSLAQPRPFAAWLSFFVAPGWACSLTRSDVQDPLDPVPVAFPVPSRSFPSERVCEGASARYLLSLP